ncbi:MAG: UDP-2,3-diacylglucosamine diphosphatase [Gammaproteobacteria bacterium]|nr:UDP-2,3-diacylglucosamine diphosphatase [Gammaproteobacteria bacterium]MBU1926302.1 UDP-2,3-diacylglucosamine diphosphatase [Gammaproteobacteria bacterium]
MNTLIIADLHLSEEQPATAALFFRFLKERAQTADALYILGDLFEVWIGDDDRGSFNQQVIQALKETSNKTPIFFMPGNRDFLIGKRFCKQAGCQLIPDPYVTSCYGISVLFTHGDLLCTQHKSYQKFRKKMHNPFRQKLFLLLPLKKRREIAKQFREKSMTLTAAIDPNLLAIDQETVELWMQKYHAAYLIHGHIHKEGVYQSQNGTKTRIVVGMWNDEGSVLELSKTEDETTLNFQLVHFK